MAPPREDTFKPREETGREESVVVQKDGGSSRDRGRKAACPVTQRELGAILVVFFGFGLALVSIYVTMPDVDYQVLKVPRNVDELRLLTDYISGYANDYTAQVVLGYCVTYIFMQTFMVPGTIFFSLLAGALFGVSRGLVLVVFSATAGASSCFFLSRMVGRPIAHWLWPDKLQFFSGEVAKRERNLLNYMLFLRITPSLPNTFINVASPIVDVPYKIFFLATFFGLIPAAFVTVRAGLALNKLHSLKDLYDAKTLVVLFLIGLVSVMPTWAKTLGTRKRRDNRDSHSS